MNYKQGNRTLKLDGLSEERFVFYMGESIESALSEVKSSEEYQNNLNNAMDEMTLQNLEQEAIYKQGYLDCLIQLMEIGVIRKG